MGDWCGSVYADREPIKRNNGCGTGAKNEAVLVSEIKIKTKKVHFFEWRGVFSLDKPFNG